MNIKLDSRIGSCSIVITAVIAIADSFNKLAVAALKQVLFHDSASEAFKDKSGFKRDASYSDALSAHITSIITAKLIALGFTDVAIVTSAYIKPTTEAKFVAEMKRIGFDDAVIAEMWAKHPDNQPKTEAKSEAKPEQGETISLS